MNKTRLIMAAILVVVSIAYLVVLDTIVMDSANMKWADLKWIDMLWTVAPAVLILINALIIVLVKRGPDVSDQTEPNRYTGDKFPWL